MVVLCCGSKNLQAHTLTCAYLQSYILYQKWQRILLVAYIL